MENKEKSADVELLPCTFKFHEFVAQVGDLTVACHAIKMEDSLYVWIGDSRNGAMNNLSLALMSNYDKLPIATRIMGPVDDTTSTNIAKRLAKKTGKPVYVSFNMSVDNMTLAGIERKICEELNAQKDLMTF